MKPVIATLTLLLAAAALAQPAPTPPDRPDGSDPLADMGRLTDEQRARIGEALDEQARQTRGHQEAIAKATAMLKDGKRLDEIRDAIGDAHFRRIIAVAVVRNARPDRPERGGRPGPGPDRRPGSADADLLGEAPGDAPRQAGGPDDRPSRGGPPGPLSDDDRRAIKDFIAATSPAMAEQFSELEARDPEAAERRLREFAPRVRLLLELRSRDQRLYELRLIDIREGRAAIEAVRELRRLEKQDVPVDDSRRTQVQSRLRAALEKQFDARSQAMSHELDKLRRRIEERPSKRDQAVDETIRRMLEREARSDRDDRGNRDGRAGPAATP
jgi:hypothetical protein